MTLNEAVALLREAYSFVNPTDTDLFDRISNALAAHDAEPVDVKPDTTFARGAEAMRNQVLGVTEVYEKMGRTCDYDAGWMRASERIAEHVRNLPVPEVTR